MELPTNSLSSLLDLISLPGHSAFSLSNTLRFLLEIGPGIVIRHQLINNMFLPFLPCETTTIKVGCTFHNCTNLQRGFLSKCDVAI